MPPIRFEVVKTYSPNLYKPPTCFEQVKTPPPNFYKHPTRFKLVKANFYKPPTRLALVKTYSPNLYKQARCIHSPSPLNQWWDGQRSYHKCLADMIAQKRQHPYPMVMGSRLFFASIRSAIMCIRGSRSSLHRSVYTDNISLASQEGHFTL